MTSKHDYWNETYQNQTKVVSSYFLKHMMFNNNIISGIVKPRNLFYFSTKEHKE